MLLDIHQKTANSATLFLKISALGLGAATVGGSAAKAAGKTIKFL